MPKQVNAIPDELNQAKLGNRQDLSDALLITASQLGMIVCRSTDELQEDRKVEVQRVRQRAGIHAACSPGQGGANQDGVSPAGKPIPFHTTHNA